MNRPSKTVYTTDPEEARRLREAAQAKPSSDLAPDKQTVRVELDRRRRAGKTVTLASGFHLTAPSLQKIAKELKQKCGAGGTAADSEIEIQGAHLDTVCSELTKRGYRVKRIG